MEHDDEVQCEQIEMHTSIRCVHGAMMQMYVVHLLEGENILKRSLSPLPYLLTFVSAM